MKTGGTSFALHAREYFAPHEVYPCPGVDTIEGSIEEQVATYASVAGLRRLPESRRSVIRLYTGHLPFAATSVVRATVADALADADNELDPNTATQTDMSASRAPIVLTLVREPVARTISTLRHFRRLRPGSVGEGGAPSRFAGWPLEAVYDDPAVHSTFIRDHQVRLYSAILSDGTGAFGSPSSYEAIAARLRDGAAAPDPLDAAWTANESVRRGALTTALANLHATDVVGTDDGYDRFVDELRVRHGWWPDGIDTRRRANVSDVSEVHDGVPASFRRRIEADNACDLEFYEAARDVAAARVPAARR